MTSENKQFGKNKTIKEEQKEIKSPNVLDKNKNKIGEFKYNDIKDLVDTINDNAISEIDAKKRLNALNEIKKKQTEIIKYKKHTPKFIQ